MASKIKQFDAATCDMLRDDLKAVFAKYGLDLNVGTMRYSPSEVRFKVEAKVSGAVGRADKLLESTIVQHGLCKVNSVGDELVGYNTKAKKYPFLYRKATDGHTYKCNLLSVKTRFAEKFQGPTA